MSPIIALICISAFLLFVAITFIFVLGCDCEKCQQEYFKKENSLKIDPYEEVEGQFEVELQAFVEERPTDNDDIYQAFKDHFEKDGFKPKLVIRKMVNEFGVEYNSLRFVYFPKK